MNSTFHNQMRTSHQGIHNGWEDSCCGHKTFDEAVTCQELQVMTLRGQMPDTRLMRKEILELAVMCGEVFKEVGMKFEHRIVKRTMTEEVMSDA